MDRRSRQTQQRGVSLVESLVALVVMSVGMLGIASLYITSLQTGRSALTRTQAVSLVNDMADRIRANPLAREAYKLSTDKKDLSDQCLGTEDCTPAALAASDLWRWLNSFGGALPSNAAGSVDFTSGAGGPDQYLVSITWQEPGEKKRFGYGVSLELMPVKP